MLFAGASTAVLIMASSLEIAKLVIASLLYQYWSTLNKILKIYLTVATVILMLLTSAGIYGYLSAAYQDTATKSTIVDQKIAALETKKKLYEQTRDNILKEKQSLNELKGNLSKGSTTQYTDKKGNLVIKSNNASFKQMESANKSDEKLSSKLDVTNDSIFSLENKILEVKTTSEASNELGPLKYISGLTGKPMDEIINWFLFVIIFVFDPLAISLVIAANFAFAKLKKPEEMSLEEKVEGMRKVVDAYDDLEDELKDWDETLMDGLEDEPYEEPKIKVVMSGEPSLSFLNKEQIDVTDDILQNIENITNSNMDFFNKQNAISTQVERFKEYKKQRDDDTITYF